MNYAQIYCTVADMIADSKSPGADEARLYQSIREASDYLQKEIGWFIPVTLTRRFDGYGHDTLIVPPLLSVTTIVNGDDTLSASDYILKPDNAYWPYGPYGMIYTDPDSSLLLAWADETDGVQITGRWGLYDRTASVGATVADTTQQSDSATTLKVSDGSRVSPGMVCLIASEQELVTGWSSPTEAVTTITEPAAITADQLTLADASLVNTGEIIRIDFEQMRITDRRTSGNLVSVIRGWNGTSRAAHADNAAVDVYRTVTVERGVNGTTAAAHANGTAINRYYTPDDVQFLTRQIATLMLNKALGGYQGRTGNAELGVVFYHDAFPRYELEQIKQRYSLPRYA
jgi:hypothetical protein